MSESRQQQQQLGKSCVVCGKDVANAPRLKDAQGRYLCTACVERLRAEQGKIARTSGGAARSAAAVGAAGVGGAGGVGGAASDQGADIREFMAQAQRAAKNQCPSCGAFAAPGSVICVNCGYDSRTQSQLQTKFGKARAGGKASMPVGLIGGVAGGVIVIGGLLYFFLGMDGIEKVRRLVGGG